MRFGQLVIGPPGAGKSTYCAAMQRLMRSLGRKVSIVNLDPANESFPYECAVDVKELVTVEDVMRHEGLGPNGALVYCVRFVRSNCEWLRRRIDLLPDDSYLIVDTPGQVELYTHDDALHDVVQNVARKLQLRLCATNIVDSTCCSDAPKFVAALITSLTAMLRLELPFVHVLSKLDLIEKDKKLDFNLDYYTQVMDLDYLLQRVSDDPFVKKFKKLNAAIVGIIEDYSLVSFLPLDIHDKESGLRVVKAVDKAIGYMFGTGEERDVRVMLGSIVAADVAPFYGEDSAIYEKYVNNSCEMD